MPQLWVEQGRCAGQDRLQLLEEIARVAFDVVISVEERIGSTGTREAPTDALRRLEIKLMAAGFDLPIGKNLDVRGSILDDLEWMGLPYDCRDEALHFSVPDEALLCERPTAGRLPCNLSGQPANRVRQPPAKGWG